MKIMVINPNTSVNMTESLARALQSVKAKKTDMTVVQASHGPLTIECAYDEAMAVPHTLEKVRQANEDGFDACVLACYSDPGIYAAREISSIPVVGIGESALHLACMLGGRFVVVTPRTGRVYAKEHEVYIRGLTHQLAAVKALDLTVEETEADPGKTKQRIIEVSAMAADESQAEVVVLGCAGMAGYSADVEAATGLTVIDPASVGLKTAEMIVSLGLSHSKRAFYARPPEKVFH